MSGLIFYMHDGPATFRFELAGDLAGVEVARLDQAWRTASSTVRGKVLAVDVTFLKSADGQGRDLLAAWWKGGAHFVANSPLSRGIVESVTGTAYIATPVGPTFEPRFSGASLRPALVALLFAITLLFPQSVSAASKIDDGSAILDLYTAGLAGQHSLDILPVTVEIDATLPKLDKKARVEAIRRWAGGHRKYQFVSVEGDSFVRNEMIARYFAIDTEAAPIAAPITKSNYKFRFVANYVTPHGAVSIFHITPRRKKQGMIDGELWIDDYSGQVTHLAGRLVKSPSILLRHIDILQETDIRDGVTTFRQTHLSIDTRFTGRAELTIREHALRGEEVAENVTR